MKNIVWQEKRELKQILRTFNYPYKLKSVANNIPIYQVTFEHRYIQSFEKRIADWFEYDVFKCRNVFSPRQKKHEPFKPIHLKYSGIPIDEVELKRLLNKNGFTIIEEDLGNTYTAYDITKI